MTIPRALILIPLLVSSCLAGCGGSDSEPASSPPAHAAPQADTTAPTISATLAGVQRQIVPTATFGYLDSASLTLTYADNVGVTKLVENIEGVSLVDGRSVLSATFDEAPVLQPSGLATIDTTAFPLGRYSVVLHAYDAAGNQAASTAVTFYVCQTGPSQVDTAGLDCTGPA